MEQDFGEANTLVLQCEKSHKCALTQKQNNWHN